MEYTISRRVAGDIDDVEHAVRDALADEGFGVLSEIDVAATLEEKLGIDDYRAYRILGACNPELAHQALDDEPALGALLPCNVVVSEAEDGSGDVLIRAVDPEAMLSIADNPELDEIAADVKERFERVLDEVAA